MKRLLLLGLLPAVGWLLAGCRPAPSNQATAPAPVQNASAPDALSLVLASHQGEGKVDREITRLQNEVRQATDPGPWLERLGWMFVAKARQSFDPGFYKLAEQCAVALESRQPGVSHEALLLRGHVLHNLHRFKEAEPLAARLVAERGLAFDFGLLSDLLMEQGRLDEAAEACQKMIDLKPSLHSYARAAHLRWLKGDLTGAVEVMQLAVGAGSPQDGESTAWVNTRLASYLFQSGEENAARRAVENALSYQTDYAPALLLRGRMKLSEGRADEAVASLQRALELNPLPEYQWVLAEALHAAGRDPEASVIEQQLARSGAANDPRTYSLYLATHRQSPETAVRLAEGELKERADVFTHDALAWSLATANRLDDAWPHLARALAEGTQDARLFFHATVMHAQAGHPEEAARFFERANALRHLLLPSENRRLQLAARAPGKKFADDNLTTGPAALTKTGE